MPAAPLPDDEPARLAALRDLGILDTPPDDELEALVRIASRVCGTPVALVTLLDEDRQWFKASIGLPGVSETPRSLAFCGYTILADEMLEVEDTRLDARFADNPLVNGAPHVRFYAGASIRLTDGSAIGTLCVIDQQPRRLDDTQRDVLRDLATVAAKAIERARTARSKTQAAMMEAHVLAAELTRQMELQAERAEREAALFRATPDLLGIIGVEEADGEIAFRYEAVNPAITQVLGVRPEDLIGQRPDDCLPPAFASALQQRYRACVARGSTLSYELSTSTPNGPRDLEGTLTPIRHPITNKIIRLASAVRDVTERKRLETALHHGQKMESIGRLAAGVAHDFNNILQTVCGSLELLQDNTSLGDAGQEIAAVALRSTQRGATLTHQLLSYARQQIFHPQAVELPGLLADLEALLTRTLGSNIAVTVRADPAANAVHADPGQLQTALLNLAINASHAMTGGGSLLIQSRPEIDEGRPWIIITVSDSGTGMDAATLARAVEPFYSTKGLQGTGLGLSMVQGFAEQSGGRLSITSVLGEGTAVTLHLPAAVSAAAVEVARPHAALGRTATILVVDDHPDVLMVTRTLLEKAGFTTIPATSAEQALALLAGEALVHVVVTDYAMPGMNGGDLLAEIRSSRPGLPGIVVSGFADLPETQALGTDVVMLRKPFPRDVLIGTLAHVLGWEPATETLFQGLRPSLNEA